MAFKSYFEAQVLGGLLEFEEYLKTTEKYLLGVKTGRETWLDEQAEALPPEERNEFYERNLDFYRAYADIFPKIFRNSFLVSVHSLLEHKMDLVCKRIKEERQIPINWSDLRGDALDRFKLYSKLAGLDLKYDGQLWQEINHYSKVRNCIIHKNGLLKEFQNDKDIIDYINKKGIISQDTIEQELALTKEFCEEAIKTIRAFLMKTYEAYYDELQRQKQKPDN